MTTEVYWPEIHEKWQRLRLSIGPDILSKDLLDRFQAEIIYVSSNLEHINLSWEDAEAVVAGLETTQSAEHPAIAQAKGQQRGLDLLEREARAEEVCSQVQLIKQLHYELMRDVHPESAGAYRTEHRVITGATIMTSMPSVIPGEVATLGSQAKAFLERREQEPLVEIVRSSAVLHHEITRIHPFDDGNGRVARLYMNYVWRSCGLPYVLLPKAGGEEEMSRVLKEADGGDMEPAVEFYSSLLEDSLDRVLVHYGMS